LAVPPRITTGNRLRDARRAQRRDDVITDQGDTDFGQLIDIELIKRLRYRYMRHLDHGEASAVASCFVDDATASFGGGRNFSSSAEIAAFVAERAGLRRSLHTAHQPEIDVDGESASGTWAIQVTSFAADGSSSNSASLYHDEYVKTNDGWRIRSIRRQLLFDHRTALLGHASDLGR